MQGHASFTRWHGHFGGQEHRDQTQAERMHSQWFRNFENIEQKKN